MVPQESQPLHASAGPVGSLSILLWLVCTLSYPQWPHLSVLSLPCASPGRKIICKGLCIYRAGFGQVDLDLIVKFYWNTVMPIWFPWLSFVLQKQSWIIAAETKGLEKPKIFIWPSKEKASGSCIEKRHVWEDWSWSLNLLTNWMNLAKSLYLIKHDS